MSFLTRIFIITVIVLLAVTHVLLYWNQHLYYEAEKIGETEHRIAMLEKAGKFYPFNDLVFYELGKAYHELGMNSLGEQGRSRIHLQKSMRQLNRSLRMNPPSYFGHFYLARTLLDLSLDSASYEEQAHQEFEKAADLAGENTEVFYEVGKIYLSQWQGLSQEEKDFTLGMLNKVFEGKDRKRIQDLFYVWEINAGDYAVMEKIFPEDAQIYRDFAEFLGARSLSLEERQKYLSKAESLEFRRAQDAFGAGEKERFNYRFKEAQSHFKSCQYILGRMQFYQNLSALPNQIEASEFDGLQKLVLLTRGKTCLEQGEVFKDAAAYLWDYLEKEDSTAAIDELESYLEKKGLLGESIIDDFDQFSFMLLLSFKQGRFRDNMRIGRDLSQSFLAVPEEQKAQLVRVFGIVGESFQKMDYIYDSNDFFQLSLERDPDNLEVLLNLRRNHERLNAVEEMREIERRIGEIVSSREIRLSQPIPKGQRYRRDMVLEGHKMNLLMYFGLGEDAKKPLITVLFNGRVVWEDYLEAGVISVPVESKVGKNVIQVMPLNRGVELEKITYETGDKSEK